MHRRIFRAVVAVAAAALSTALVACGPGESDQPSSLGVGVEPGLFSALYDPISATGLGASAVYESLLSYNEATSEYDPLLATSFELSDDRKTIQLTLRDDVDFIDGEHFDAAVAAAVMTALIEREAAQAIWRFPDHDVRITAIGEYQLEITVAIPTSLRPGDAFMDLVFLPLFSPAYLDDFEALGTAPVGTGPYVLDEVVPDVSATFTLNENYWNEEIELFDSLEIVVFADEIASLNALKSGQIDAVRISSMVAAEAETNGFRVVEGVAGTFGLWIADRGGSIQPALGDLRVREAIQYAFDREAINESMNAGFGETTSQSFAAGTPEYVEGGDDRYGYDPEKARSLLAEAGYEDGFDITIPSTTFLGINNWEPIVTQYLGDVGIRVTFEMFSDTGTYFEAALGGTFPVLLYQGSGSAALDIFFLPDAILGFPAYSDTTLDGLAATMTNGDLEESVQAQSAIGEYVLDQAWFAVFAAQPLLWATSPEIEIIGVEYPGRATQFRPAG
jgi:peptide/nickel transport system substrate-binding protein